MAVINELVTKFSFEGSTKPLNDYNASFAEATKIMAAGIGVMTAATAAFGAFVTQTLESTDAQVQLARTLGESIETIQELGFSASVSGSSVEAIESTLSSLGDKIGDAAQKGNEDFNRLGISVRDANGQIKSSSQVLDEVGKRFQALKLTEAEKASFAGKLGIDKSLLQMMSLTGSEMDSLRMKAQQLGVVTSEQGDQVASFYDSLTILKYGFDALKKNIAIGFAPQIQELAGDFTDFLIANKELITGGISKFIKIIASAFKAIFRFADLINTIIDSTIGWKIAIEALTLAFIYLNRAMFMNPIGLIIAGVIAVIAIIDDFIVALNGGKSVINDFLMEFLGFDIQTVVSGIVSGFNMMVNQIKILFNGLLDFFANIWDAITKVFSGDFEGAIDSVYKAFQALGDAISRIFDNVFEAITAPLNSLKETFGDLFDSAGGVINDVGNLFGFGDDAGVANQTNVAGATQNNSVNIEIKTDNPQQAGAAVENALSRTLDQANAQFKRGGR